MYFGWPTKLRLSIMDSWRRRERLREKKKKLCLCALKRVFLIDSLCGHLLTSLENVREHHYHYFSFCCTLN